MSRRNRLEHLSSLREEIAALLVVKCHMSHERVVRAADSVLPVVCHFPEDNYQRIGLCSPEVRTQRLGCSHTMARIKLERAINELDLEAESTNETASDSSNELSFLDNEIHLLDHRKGEGETALAGIVTEALTRKI